MARSKPTPETDTRPPLELFQQVKVAPDAPLPQHVRKLTGGIGKLVDMFDSSRRDLNEFLVNFGSDETPIVHPVTIRDLSPA